MSRLYDALKGARRFREGPDGNAGEEVWEALGINGADVPPVLTEPDGRETIGLDTVSQGGLGVVIPEEEVVPGDTTAGDSAWGTPATTTLDKKARVIPHAMNPVIAEHYRRLRTKIIQQQTEKPFRSLVVTSANPQEGKTVTVLNLGLSFSMLPSYKVLVVDGDMRRGTLGRWLGVEHDRPGLSNLIDGSAQLEDVILKSDEIPMHFMVRGNSQVPDLVSSQLDLHFQRIAEQFDLVLVDTPPVNLIADVQLLAASCDAVLLVARAFATTRKAFEKAVEELLPFRVIGTVLNAGMEERYGYGGY
jgi:capsular exopolysaccharide synthesis family protein